MATANNGNNNTQNEVGTSNNVKETCVSNVKNDRMPYEHSNQYTHPNKNCKFQPNCTNKSDEHRRQFAHTTVTVVSNSAIKQDCKFGTDCGNMQTDHLEKYIHPKKNCRFQPKCTNKSEEHHRQFAHTSATAVSTSATTTPLDCCKFGADCTNTLPYHMVKYVHPLIMNCKFQPKCTNKSEEHRRQFAHISATTNATTTPVNWCKFGADCTNTLPYHMEKYVHPLIMNCKFQPKCTNKSEEHHQQFAHTSRPSFSPTAVSISPTAVSISPTAVSTSPTAVSISPMAVSSSATTTPLGWCKFGADCTNTRPYHMEKYIHPPIIKYKEVHHCLYCYNNKHKIDFKCPYEHTSATITPLDWCKFGADCKNTLPNHMEKYIHSSSGRVFWNGEIVNYPVDNCYNGATCKDKSEEHLQFIHACATALNKYGYCANWCDTCSGD